jgi:hypothetical protein
MKPLFNYYILKNVKKKNKARRWWHTPVILGTWEAKIRKIPI